MLNEGNNVYFYATIVRHGETNENKTQTIQGHMDTLLSPVGIKQANDLGASLSSLCIDLIISSDLKRAYQTAEQIQTKLTPNPPLKTFKLMRERNFGTNNGKPRAQIHEFIALTKGHHDGCKMWKDCEGECGHQVFWRALEFFFELCNLAKNRVSQEAPVFPYDGGFDRQKSDEFSLPMFLPIQQPPVPLAFPPLPQFDEENLISENKEPEMKYGGHFMLVSHGQWIREFISILSMYSSHTLGFPSNCKLMPVLTNCQFSQFGICFDPNRLASYFRMLKETVTSSLWSAHDCNLRAGACGYDIQTKEHMPVNTVCYHTRLSVDTVLHGRLTAEEEEAEKNMKKEIIKTDLSVDESLAAGTGVETLYFLDEDDEYAGLPMEKN